MIDHSAMLSSLCGPDGAPNLLTLLGSLFLAGVVGSVAHCGPMCGPFVLAQVSRNWARLKLDDMCPRQRVRQGLLLPYHFGRLLTYSGLGAIAAASGAVVGKVPGLGVIPSVLLLLGALMLFGQAMTKLLPARMAGWLAAVHLPWRWGAPLSRLANRIDRDSPRGAVLFGVVLGFLPCGLLYAALAVAASTAGPLDGALAMCAFGLGTVPSLAALGVFGQMVGRHWGGVVTRVGPALLLLNAVILTVMAWQRFAALV